MPASAGRSVPLSQQKLDVKAVPDFTAVKKGIDFVFQGSIKGMGPQGNLFRGKL